MPDFDEGARTAMAHKNRSNWSPYTERLKAKGQKPGPQEHGGKKYGGKSGEAISAADAEARFLSGARPSDQMKGGQLNGGRGTQRRNSVDEKDQFARGYTAGAPKSRHKKADEHFTFHEADDRIFSIFRNHGFEDFPHAKRQQLTRFYELLMENQKKQNFTRLNTLREIAIKHFVDSLMVTKLTDLMFPLLDVGTGPGFPGIPLKVAFPDEKIILAEGVQKRVEFLKLVREDLKLKNLDVIGRNVNAEFVYPVQGVITRALEDSRNTLGNVINCLQTGGRVYLMKGPNVGPEIQMALDEWGEYYALDKDIAYSLPETPHERRLLIFKKIKSLPVSG